MGLKVSDATKEELIQYFFTEDTFGGGHRLRADEDRFLLWLAKKRAVKLMEAQEAAMDTEQESLRKYIETIKALNEEKDIDKKLQLAETANKYYKQYESAGKQAEQIYKKLDTIYDF